MTDYIQSILNQDVIPIRALTATPFPDKLRPILLTWFNFNHRLDK